MRSRAQASGSGRRCARRGGRGLGTAGARAGACRAAAGRRVRWGFGGGARAGRPVAGRAGQGWRARGGRRAQLGHGRASRGRGGGGRGPGVRGREERKGREGERKWEKEKKKKKKKEGRKGKKERGREGSAPGSRRRSRSLSATLGVRARESATRGSRKNRVLDTGVGSLGNREIWRNREDSGKLGLGFQGGILSSTTKQNFSARFI